MQVRGNFKITFIASNSYSVTVARYTRAWIETLIDSPAINFSLSPAIRGRGLKRTIPDNPQALQGR
ncbi:MAG TPA: hypothetical protein PKB02_14770, partial [Anaerohalosphaeraceae bacterium]|nr:hypothetical protein [Anaerohalosphaeraceae bacterium]